MGYHVPRMIVNEHEIVLGKKGTIREIARAHNELAEHIEEQAKRVDELTALVREQREDVDGMGEMAGNRTTELATIIEALTALASAISWTVPNSTQSVESCLKDAWAAIDKLRGGCDD